MSSDLKAQLQADLITARKAREKLATAVLSTTLAEIKNREIELGGEADEKDVMAAVTRAIKRRREAADLMQDGGREDLAEKELAEAEILKKYLPPEMGEDEVRAIIREIIAGGTTQMGPVMGQLMPRLQGRFNGKAATRMVQEELAG